MQVPPFMQGFGIQSHHVQETEICSMSTKYTLTLGYSKYKVALSIKIYGNYRNKKLDSVIAF